jgi:microcystin degradation protein MlrC
VFSSAIQAAFEAQAQRGERDVLLHRDELRSFAAPPTSIASPSTQAFGSMTAPRVAILGVFLESNRQAPVAVQADFEAGLILRGEAILADARATHPRLSPEAAAFVRTMDATGPWSPVPILFAISQPHGPIAADLHERFLEEIVTGLRGAGPLDAVFIANHGGMIATQTDDPDGEIIAAVRGVVGPSVPIVVTLDLHANISQRMVEQSNLIIGYLTNPHVDMIARGEEAALALRLILAGRATPQAVLIRLPLTPASVTLLTHEGPYADLISYGQRRQAEEGGRILNVSIFGGFVFSDSEKNGLAIIVTGRYAREPAAALAKELAERCWADRPRFRKTLTTIEQAVDLAKRTDRAPVIFSDSGDNPGGGGTGRTTDLLQALIRSGATDVLYGSLFDPPLADAANKAGVGSRFRARVNSHAGLPCDAPFEADAEVIGLHDGDIVGRLGIFAGRSLKLGPCAALRIGGVTVIVVSARQQTADPMFFEMFGLDIGKARTVAVKSRGHFRAGFRPWFPSEQVYEIDTEGLTSPVLERRQWTRLPRPVYPLDEGTTWTLPAL